MVMGHIGYGYKFDFFIHAFHMPMFFFISGYFFKHSDIKLLVFAKKKATSLLIPYFVFGFAHYIIYIIMRGFKIEPLYHLLYINTEDLPIAGALWFLTALFITNIIYFIIDRYIQNELIKFIMVFVISILGNLSKVIFPSTLPYALSPAFVGVGLYYLGYKIRQYENVSKFINKMMNMRWYLWIIVASITIYLIFFNGYVNMRTGEYSNILLFWINALFSIFVGLNLSKYLLLIQVTNHNIVCMYLSGIGRDSVVYVCLNQLAVSVVVILFNQLSFSVISQGVIGIFELLMVLGILWICTQIITKTKLKYLIGKY